MEVANGLPTCKSYKILAKFQVLYVYLFFTVGLAVLSLHKATTKSHFLQGQKGLKVLTFDSFHGYFSRMSLSRQYSI